MNTIRNTARIVGVLYIIGTVTGILSAVLSAPILTASDYLTKISATENQIIINALLVLIMGFALAMVPVMMFPIFRKHNESLAIGAVVFRGALEAVLYIAIVINWFLLLTVSQEYVKSGSSNAPHFQTLGTVLLHATKQINTILEIVFSVGGLMIYYLFYQSKLIPRWLSVWGLLGATLYLSVGLFAMFSMDFDFLLAPLALQEMVLAVWLIVKGFNLDALASETVQNSMKEA